MKPKTETSQEGKKSPASSKNTAPAESKKPFNIAEYFKGVKQEWYKITWPASPQVIAETGIVIVVVAIFGVFVFVADKFFQLIIQWIT